MPDQGEADSPRVSSAKNLKSSFTIAEIEALKSGYHAAHANLTKEQITILSDDISELRQDVLQLRDEVGLANGQDRLRDRVTFMEKDTSDSFDKHTKAMDDLLQSNDGYRASLESRVSKMEDAILGTNVKELGQIPHRIALLEQDCRDAADKHCKQVNGLQAVSDKHSADLRVCREALCKRLESLEESIKEFLPEQMRKVEDVQMSHDSLLRDWEEFKVDHGPLPQRLGFLEKQFNGSVDKVNKMSVDLWGSVDDLRRTHSENAAFHGRVASLESELGRLAETYWKELGECQTRHDKATKDLVSLESKHATIAERTAILERRLGDAADELTKMSEKNGTIRAGVLHDVQEWLSTMRDRLEFVGTEARHSSNSNAKKIDDVKRASHDNTEKTHARQVAMEERIDHLESTVTKFSEKYCRRLTDLHHQHAELSSNSESILNTMRERLEFLGTVLRHPSNNHAKAIEDVKRISSDTADKIHARHVAMAERIDHLENTLTEFSEKYCRVLADLQHQHAELSNSSESMPDRVARVEQQQRDSTDKFAKDLQILQRSRDQLESRIAEIKGDSDGCRASVARRVDTLERAVREKADQQATELADLRQAHQGSTRHVSHAAMEERLGSVERYGAKQVDDLRGELRRHRKCTDERLEACETLLHRELSGSHDRARLIARELQRDVDVKVALVNELTRSESSPSLSAASLKACPGGQSAAPSSAPLTQSPWSNRALRRSGLAHPPLDVEGGMNGI